MSQKLFIFDMDGTLIQFHHNYLFNQAHRIYQKVGLSHITMNDIGYSFENFDFFRVVPEDQREKIMHDFWVLFDWKNFPEPALITGTRELLKKLKEKNHKVALATSRLSTPDVITRELAKVEILDYFDIVTCREDDNLHWTDKKPMIKKCIETLGCNPKDAVMVGDIPTDISSATEVGVEQTIAVRTGGLLDEVFQAVSPTYLFDSIKDIENLLK